jgi:hypothetical protein
MGNLFDEIGTCYTCYDEGILFIGMNSEGFINDFCSDCEKGSVLASEYAVWYAKNEINERTKEMENA